MGGGGGGGVITRDSEIIHKLQLMFSSAVYI